MSSIGQFTDPATSLCVQASAGTGKTYLLIKRLMRILLRERKANSTLALTFSNRAVAELRLRLLEEIKMVSNLDDAKLDAWLADLGETPSGELRAAARGIRSRVLNDSPVNISTFHGFCKDLTTRFALHNGRDSSFQVVTNQEPLLLRARIELLQENNGELLRQAGISPQMMEEFLGEMGSDFSLGRVLEEAHLNTESLHLYWQRWRDAKGNIDFDRLRASLADESIKEPDIEIAGLQQKAKDFAESLLTAGGKKGQEAAERLLSLPEATTLEDLASRLGSAFLTSTGSWRKQLYPKKLAGALEGPENEIREGYERIVAYLLQRKAVALNVNWQRLAWCYFQVYQNIKRRFRLLDFDDMQLQAWELLRRFEDHSAIQHKLSARIRHILIDEFQDTNLLQWEIIWPFVEEIVCQRHSEASGIFIIGDSKQMIYRFRGAEIRLFDIVCKRMKDDYNIDTASIDHSYRTGPAVLNWLNPVFSGMSMPGFREHHSAHPSLPSAVICLPLVGDDGEDDAGDVDGGADDGKGASKPPEGDGTESSAMARIRATHINDALGLPLHPRDQDWDDGGDDLEEEIEETEESAGEEEEAGFDDPLHPPESRLHQGVSDLELEAERVVDLLESLHQRQFLITRKNGKATPMEWGDVLLLSRRRRCFDAYAQIFERRQIHLLTIENRAQQAPYPWHTLLSLLRCMLNPHDDIALLATLCSPLFGITEAQLLELAEAPQGGRSLWQRLQASRGWGEPSAGLLAWRRACDALERYIALSFRLPTHDLVSAIYEELGVYQCFCAGLDSHKAGLMRNVLDNFLFSLLDIQTGRYTSLYGIVEELQAMVDMNQSLATPLELESGNAARLMTVHSAKGLEAPIVALVDFHSKGSGRKDYTVLRRVSPDFDIESLLLLRGNLKDAPLYAPALEQDRLESRQDSLNQLYVATTRAAQLLIVSASGKWPKNPSGDNPSWFEQICAARGIDRHRAHFWGASPRFAESAAPSDKRSVIGKRADPGKPRPVASPSDISGADGNTRQTSHRKDSGSATADAGATPAWTGFGQASFAIPAAPPLRGQRQSFQARFDGTLVHRVLSLMAPQSQSREADRLDGHDSIVLQVKRRISLERSTGASEIPPSEEDLDRAIDKARALMVDARLGWIFKPELYQRAWNELPLLHLAEGASSRLYIDRLVDTGDCLWIIDYKARIALDGPGRDKQMRGYCQQLERYRQALSLINKEVFPECTQIRSGFLSVSQRRLIPYALGSFRPITLGESRS